MDIVAVDEFTQAQLALKDLMRAINISTKSYGMTDEDMYIIFNQPAPIDTELLQRFRNGIDAQLENPKLTSAQKQKMSQMLLKLDQMSANNIIDEDEPISPTFRRRTKVREEFPQFFFAPPLRAAATQEQRNAQDDLYAALTKFLVVSYHYASKVAIKEDELIKSLSFLTRYRTVPGVYEPESFSKALVILANMLKQYDSAENFKAFKRLIELNAALMEVAKAYYSLEVLHPGSQGKAVQKKGKTCWEGNCVVQAELH